MLRRRPLILSLLKDALTPALSHEGRGGNFAAYPVTFCNRGSVRLGGRSVSKVLMTIASMV